MKTRFSLKTHLVILFGSLMATFLTFNFTESVFETLMQETHSTILAKRRTKTRQILDDSGVPITDYGHIGGTYVGEQRNPVNISRKGLEYYSAYERGDGGCLQPALNCANWIVNNSVSYDDYAILEYTFPFPRYNKPSPWRSGMAQGKAIQLLIRAHSVTRDTKYLRAAEKLLGAFFVAVENGGVTYKTSDQGWWYEEYAHELGKMPRVLNGMIFAVIGIYEYYQYTGEAKAKYLYDQGLVAIKNSLPNYDRTKGSYYDALARPASKKYHDLHIHLLDRLYAISKESIFVEFRERWETRKEDLVIFQLIHHPTKKTVSIFIVNFLLLLVISEVVLFGIGKFRSRQRQAPVS